MMSIGGRQPPAMPCSTRSTVSAAKPGANGHSTPSISVASTAPIVKRFSVKVTPNHGANTMVATLAASNSAVSQVPSSWPMENAPRMSAIAAAVTCSLRMASKDAISMPARPVARRGVRVGGAAAPAWGAGVAAMTGKETVFMMSSVSNGFGLRGVWRAAITKSPP